MGNKCQGSATSADEWVENEEFVRCELRNLRLEVQRREKTLKRPPSKFDKDLAKMTRPQLDKEREQLAAALEKLEELDAQHYAVQASKSSFKKNSETKGSNPRTEAGNPVTVLQADAHPAAGVLSKEELKVVEDPGILLGQESEYGLTWNAQWAGKPAGPQNERHRRKVREGTMQKVTKELGLAYFGEAALQTKLPSSFQPLLFLDTTAIARESGAPSGGANLLGRYDIVCGKVCADFDRCWNFIKDNRKDFWVVHAAAVNIGESTDAPDFVDFCAQPGALHEEKYYTAMGRIMHNVASACDAVKAEHIVVFPFGMGAFLRHLGLIDTSFSVDEEMQRLRRRVAIEIMKALAQTSPKTKIHLCLQLDNEEAHRNADALIRGLLITERAFMQRVTLHPDGECLDLAHELAKTSNNVALVNGANRRLIGNHWFADHARRAIDENLHRRSWKMAALAYLLNNFATENNAENPVRAQDELKRSVERLGGTIRTLAK